MPSDLGSNRSARMRCAENRSDQQIIPDAPIAQGRTLPLIRFGLISSWLLGFMIFVREYSTGVYLQGPGTEVLGR